MEGRFKTLIFHYFWTKMGVPLWYKRLSDFKNKVPVSYGQSLFGPHIECIEYLITLAKFIKHNKGKNKYLIFYPLFGFYKFINYKCEKL